MSGNIKSGLSEGFSVPAVLPLPKYVTAVLDIMEGAGYEAYAVGGCVRDMIMGVEPHDYDVTTNALPDQIKECFRGFRVIETGIKHGTVTVISDGHNIEITTYRIDGKYSDNRHPEAVTFTEDIHHDLSRRDFTVNAMAYSPKRGLVDRFDGCKDIERKIIRCVGAPAQRFGEDGLRILRALRFASVLGFSIEPATASAIHECRELLSNISVERIYSEFTKLICGGGCENILTEYGDVFGIFIQTEDILDKSNEQYVRAAGICALCPVNACDRYAALLGFTGGQHSSLTLTTLEYLKSDNATKNRASRLSRMLYGYTKMINDAKYVRHMIYNDGYEYSIEASVIRSAAYTYDGNVDGIENEMNFRVLADIENRACNRCFTIKEMRIGGSDLKRLGIKGPAIGRILNRLLYEVVDGRLENRHDRLTARAAGLYKELLNGTEW